MRINRINNHPEIIEQEEVDLNLLDPVIERLREKKGNMIPLLQGAQEIYGYLPNSVLEKLSFELDIPLSDMYGVATFYAQFRLKPAGKHIIKVCHGTACHVQNADELTTALSESLDIADGETTKDNFFTLESVACLGCCSLAPVMMIGEHTYGKLSGEEAVKIINEIRISDKK